MKKINVVFCSFAGLLVIILVIFAVIYSYKPTEESSLNGCIKAGEAFENASLGPDGRFGECCSGLVGISGGLQYSPHDDMADDDGCVPLMGSASICSNCGNGKCEEWENKCNCTKDCK